MRKKISFLILTILAVGSLYFLAFPKGDEVFAGVGSVIDVIKIDSSTTNGPTTSADDNYGYSVSNIGDLNNDGIDDVAVGAPDDDAGGFSRGAVHIHFMNTDGSIDSTVEINDLTANGPTLSNLDRYGTSVTGLGDLNNDGVIDIAVGAPRDDSGGVDFGAFYIHFMNTDGSIDSTVEINDLTANGPDFSGTWPYFGSSIDGSVDLNADGVNDIIVGAPLDDESGFNFGAFYILFMNTDGSVDSTVKINDLTTNGPALDESYSYGASVSFVGDINDDGVVDIAVGADSDGSLGAGRGSMFIHFMNIDGSIDSTTKINGNTSNGPTLLNNGLYGSSIRGIGDLNADGVEDIAVGAPGDSLLGATYLHFMNEDASIYRTFKMTSANQDGLVLSLGASYGYSIAHLGDFNSDGVEDIAVGALNEEAFFIHFLELTPDVLVTQTGSDTTVYESGLTDTINVVLDFVSPNDPVTVTLVSSSPDMILDQTTLVFDNLNWDTPQAVTISAVNDTEVEGAEVATISYIVESDDVAYDGYAISNTSVNIVDNDSGVLYTIIMDYGSYDLSEDGDVNIVDVVLSGDPGDDVTVTLIPDDQITLDIEELFFTSGDWDLPQTVTITAIDDLDVEGLHDGLISSTSSSLNPDFNNLSIADVSLLILDNDVGVVVTETNTTTEVTEGGATDTFSVVMSTQPTDDVVVTMSSDAQISLDANILTFTTLDWDTSQVVTVTAINDAVIEGNHTGLVGFAVSSFDVNYDLYLLEDVTASITDNDPEPEPDPEPQASGSSSSSGFIMPHIRFKDKIKDTDFRFVDLEAYAPYTITYFEISNTPDFFIKETYQREYTQKDLYWDLCKGLSSCVSGEKLVYARFYSDVVGVREDVISINYNPKLECPYFKGFLRKGSKTNDPLEVKKAQEFLNRELNINLDIDGIFGKYTDRAVRDFQEKYPQEILFPWQGLTKSTGWWYITTSRYANILMGCK